MTSHVRHERRPPSEAFTLVELVMVVVIIGIVAAIAVPRISRSAKSALQSEIAADLNNVRDAIDRFYAEHGVYPGYDPSSGTADGDWFIKQLTQYSDRDGNVSNTPDSDHLYGPYLSRSFPVNPLNNFATVRVKAKSSAPVLPDASTGWISYRDIGSFDINADAEELNAVGVDASRLTQVAGPQ